MEKLALIPQEQFDVALKLARRRRIRSAALERATGTVVREIGIISALSIIGRAS
jgi:hypothetical protein